MKARVILGGASLPPGPPLFFFYVASLREGLRPSRKLARVLAPSGPGCCAEGLPGPGPFGALAGLLRKRVASVLLLGAKPFGLCTKQQHTRSRSLARGVALTGPHPVARAPFGEGHNPQQLSGARGARGVLVAKGERSSPFATSTPRRGEGHSPGPTPRCCCSLLFGSGVKLREAKL